MKPYLTVCTILPPEIYGECIHDAKDYDLEYKIHTKIDSQFLLIYDTLTITFDFKNKKFVGFDAYTNKDRWILDQSITSPSVYEFGQLQIEHDFFDGNRYSPGCSPLIRYSNKGLIKIEFEKNEKGFFYKIAPGLFVELSNNKLSSFIIEHYTTQ